MDIVRPGRIQRASPVLASANAALAVTFAVASGCALNYVIAGLWAAVGLVWHDRFHRS